MDVQTDSLIHDNLKKSKVVAMSLSEERPYPTILSKKGSYIVTFDPIEGSNIIESKYTSKLESELSCCKRFLYFTRYSDFNIYYTHIKNYFL